MISVEINNSEQVHVNCIFATAHCSIQLLDVGCQPRISKDGKTVSVTSCICPLHIQHLFHGSISTSYEEHVQA